MKNNQNNSTDRQIKIDEQFIKKLRKTFPEPCIYPDMDINNFFFQLGLQKGITKIEEIMSKNIKTIHATAPVEKAADIMKKNRIKKLPVILNNEIVGIITVTDIANILPNFSKEIIEQKEAFRFVNPTAP